MGSSALGKATSSERKALATMGRRGGQKAAQRWKTAPDSDYAKQERAKLAVANENRKTSAAADSFAIASWFLKGKSETGEYPTVGEAAAEFSVSNRTVQRALSKAGIVLPTGRRKGDRP